MMVLVTHPATAFRPVRSPALAVTSRQLSGWSVMAKQAGTPDSLVFAAITSMPARDTDVVALTQEPSDVLPQLSAYDQRDVASVFLSER